MVAAIRRLGDCSNSGLAIAELGRDVLTGEMTVLRVARVRAAKVARGFPSTACFWSRPRRQCRRF